MKLSCSRSSNFSRGYWGYWGLVENGIYFYDTETKAKAIEFFDFRNASGDQHCLGTDRKPPAASAWLEISLHTIDPHRNGVQQ